MSEEEHKKLIRAIYFVVVVGALVVGTLIALLVFFILNPKVEVSHLIADSVDRPATVRRVSKTSSLPKLAIAPAPAPVESPPFTSPAPANPVEQPPAKEKVPQHGETPPETHEKPKSTTWSVMVTCTNDGLCRVEGK